MAFRILPSQLFALKATIWPETKLYDKQVDIASAAVTARETYVTAGNKLGKDFVMGFVAPACFKICQEYGVTCRILTNSVAEHHLKVLWGEIGRFVSTGVLLDGRPLAGRDPDQWTVNHMEIRRSSEALAKNPLSYLAGRVSEHGEGMAGHHAEFTMFIGDEASGLDPIVHEMVQGWANHIIYIGNPNECQNQFRKGVKAGDAPSDGRRVIRVRAEDSPNVILQSDDAFPGVLTYGDYQWRRKNWDKVRQCVGLDGEFYEGAEVLLFPPEWINRAERLAEALGRDGKGNGHWGIDRITMGIDPAEGGDMSSFCIGDARGIIELVSTQTPDTSIIPATAIKLMRKYRIDPSDVCIDRGGGGKQHADTLRMKGYPIRTVAFGEAVVQEPRYGAAPASARREIRETAYEYKNRRAQMGGELRELLDPAKPDIEGFGIPIGLRGNDSLSDTQLRHQMAPIPLKFDPEGRMVLPPKHKRSETSEEVTLVDLIGHSPDELDALFLQTHALLHRGGVRKVGRLV
jgi:hypothetical protein